MNIDKSKLKMGIWYEDPEGNVYRPADEEYLDSSPEGYTTYHSLFPLEITEHVYTVNDRKKKAECKHKRKWWKKDRDLIKGYKGHMCTRCGCTQTRKWYEPWGRNWDNGASVTPLIDFHTTIGGGNAAAIIGMVNSGDYTLSEALAVWASGCERCDNALAYKYTNGADGYPEDSDEYRACNTCCDFCRN